MTVTIISAIPVYAGPTDIVTSITAPNIPGGGTIGIGDIVGLQAALDLKLNDAIGDLGPIPTAVTITGAELNFLSGLTQNVETALDGKVDIAGDTMTGSLFMDTGAQIALDVGTALLPSLAFDVDLDTGIWWPMANTLGFAVGGTDVLQILPSGLIQSQITDYETLVLADDDIPNKKYVDDEIAAAVGGPFLPLAGGVMTGDIDLDGNALILDADGDSQIASAVDDTVVVTVGGATRITVDFTNTDFHGAQLQNVATPTLGDDAANKNYVDAEITALNLGGVGPFLQLAGGTMSGDIDMDGNGIINLVDPTNPQDAMTLAYADANYVNLNGATGPLGGDLDAGGNNIVNVADPVNPQDAATMNWVDSNFLNLDGSSAMTGDLDMGGFLITNLAAATANDEAVTLGQANSLYFRLDGSSAMTADADIGGFKLINVANPTLAQDAVTLSFANSTYIRADGTTALTGDWSAGGNLINDVADPVAAQDAATMNYVDTEIAALNLGGTGPFLQLAGGTMSGAIDMDGNFINDLSDPSLAQDAATKNYVDTEITALNLGGTGPFLQLAGGTMTGDITMDTNAQVLADDGTSSNPGYAFDSSPSTGMLFDGTNLQWSLVTDPVLTISPSAGANEVDVHGRRITGVDDPTDPTDAVTLNYFESVGVVKVLARVTGINLLSTGTTALFTVPVGNMDIVTQVIVRATSYAPGAGPTNPEISIGTSGPNYNNIIGNNTVLDWGGTAGAADQAVYLTPDDGAETPNAGTTVTLQVDTAGGGTFSALVAEVIVLGLEL